MRENRLFHNRAVVALMVVSLLMCVLLGRMLYLQHLEYQRYSKLSDENRIGLSPLPPTRGLIYDRKGRLLAENRSVFNLIVIPNKIKSMDDTIAALTETMALTEDDLTRFAKLRKQHRRYEPIPIRKHLTEKEIATFSVNRHKFPGVEVRAQLTRHYPYGSATAHVVGFVGQINEDEIQKINRAAYSGTQIIGKTGVENRYENLLLGKVGHQHLETDARGRSLQVLNEDLPTPGTTLHLTIDADLQLAAAKALEGYRGALVAINPKTGALLALQSNPSYDPNVFSDGVDSKAIRSIQKDPDRPLYNRAMQGTYPPGSTVKPFYAIMGLETGAVTPSYSIRDPGYFRLPGVKRPFRDWKKGGHGRVNLEKSIVSSCDTYYYRLAHKVGIQTMHDYMVKFNFGSKTGIDIAGERSGVMPSPDWKRGALGQPWYPGETVIAGIGQGFVTATTLQLAQATAIIANRGNPIKPHALAGTTDSQGHFTPYQPEIGEPIQLAKDSYWQHVIKAMVNTVHTGAGTARRIGNSPYRFAGKTGTSQVFTLPEGKRFKHEDLAEHLRSHGLFISFAPADDPEVATAVIIENGGSGSALNPTRAFLDAYFGVTPKEKAKS